MSSPFSLASECMQRVRGWRARWPSPAALHEPAQWLRQQWQQRLVLFVNHVLMQHPAAMLRLKRHTGRVMALRWRGLALRWQVTPAGLLEGADPQAAPDLRLLVIDRSPLALARHALLQERPRIRISGDAHLASDMGWLLEHVRWDVEDDLARLLGDAPAHALAGMARRVAEALRQFVRTRLPAPGGEADGDAAPLVALPPSTPADAPWDGARPGAP